MKQTSQSDHRLANNTPSRRAPGPRWVENGLLRVIGFVGSLLFCVTAVSQEQLQIQLADRFVKNGECSFTINLPFSTDAVLRKNLSLDMPGYRQIQSSGPDARGLVLVTAVLTRPGFYPFQARLRWNGKEYLGKDYCVYERADKKAFDHLGYYVFLGRGDFWDPTHQLAQWTLRNWKAFADWMSVHQVDTLYVLVNGYTLAYPSDKYQSLRDKLSNNARYNFLHNFIDYAHTRGIRVYLTLTTDDHAQGFGEQNPETIRIDKFGFAGSPRALTLEDPKVQAYIRDMLAENLRLYGNADGVVFHPSEEDPDRFNPATQDAFYRDTGNELTQAPKADRYRWYNKQFAEFMRLLYTATRKDHPQLEFIMFNTWWQDEYVSVYQETLPADFKICVWFYDEHEEKAFRKWPIWAWQGTFGAERIVYMPTGEAFLYPSEHMEQIERHIRTDRLISAAESLGVRSCVFFAGWDLGSDDDRRRDLAIAEFPTTSFAPDQDKKQELLPRLYTDFFGTRKEILK